MILTELLRRIVLSYFYSFLANNHEAAEWRVKPDGLSVGISGDQISHFIWRILDQRVYFHNSISIRRQSNISGS